MGSLQRGHLARLLVDITVYIHVLCYMCGEGEGVSKMTVHERACVTNHIV